MANFIVVSYSHSIKLMLHSLAYVYLVFVLAIIIQLLKWQKLQHVKGKKGTKTGFYPLLSEVFCSSPRAWQRGVRDPISHTKFNRIQASRFESVIVVETSGKRNFHDQTQIIHESRIPHEINHASHAFQYSRITFLFK